MKLRLTLYLSFFLVASALSQSILPHSRKAFRAGAAAFAPSSATWDGVNDRINFTSISLADGAVITICFWVNVDVQSGTQYVLNGRTGGSGSQWGVWTGNNIQFSFRNAANTEVVNAFGNGGLTAGWHHVMISIDTAASANTRLYLDGVNYLNTVATFSVASTLDLTQGNLYVGNNDDNSADFGGCLAEVWIDDVYTDFSNSTNRTKFYTASGDPVDLGTTGATPFGVQPDVYLRFVSGSLGVNSGSDGGTGTLEGNVANGDCGVVGN